MHRKWKYANVDDKGEDNNVERQRKGEGNK